VSADAVRLLALRSEIGYTERIDRALPDEPEAVSAAEQRYQTRQSARQRVERDRAQWTHARAEIVAYVEDLHVEIDVDAELRAIVRACERIDRKLGIAR
jgi:hypothetical protein